MSSNRFISDLGEAGGGRFTGQRSYTPDFGLYYYGSRWYDPALGRFIQPDSIVPDPSNPQDLNRFSYVRNNPLRYTDPTGHRVCDDFDTVGGCYTAPGSPAGGTGGGATYVRPRGGGGSSGSRGGVLQSEPPPPGHSYDNLHNEPHAVCLDVSWISCTDTEVADYLSRWQYPGQFFWNPVQNQGRYNVFPERIGSVPTIIGLLWPGSGAIRVAFGDHSISNVALPTHVFFEGYVERKWSRDENGVPYVTTHGEGTNDGFALVTIPIKNVETDLIFISGSTIDGINQRMGPYAFELLDAGLLTYTTIIETGQHLSSLWP